MITITRALARRLRVVFARAMGRSRSGLAPVLFRSDPSGLTLAVQGHDAAIEYHFEGAAGSTPSAVFALPLDALKQCEGTSDTLVTFEPEAESVTVRWADAGVPQIESFPRNEPFDLPPRPERMEANDARLPTALRDAAECTDAAATRYALSCVQLSGDGRIAATDAHRLLVQRGFAFPWTDDVLVPAGDLFASKELHTDEPVSVGRTDNHVTLSTGPWTVHLRIEKDARFPRIDSIIPEAAKAESVLHLAEDDCEFLLNALPRLPGRKEPDSPVTCDLNGQVSIRSRGEEQTPATELLLTNSRLSGKPVLTQTNRELLAHAVRLGFRTLHLFDPSGNVLCQDEHRQLVWMLLGSKDIVPTEAGVIRIESPVSSTAAPKSRLARVLKRNRRARAKPTAGSAPSPRPVRAETGRGATNGSSAPSRSAVEQLVALRDMLKAAVQQTNDAIRTLKRRHREDRLLRSTLSSLRQLQGIAS